MRQQDIIVARATPPGPGAIAIVRVDGPGAGDLIGRLFRPAGSVHPVDDPRRAILGRWIDPATGDAIDDGLTIFFRAPHSYTGNDLAELQCHGGAAVVRGLIAASIALGARPAEPGEFTRRAFLNGRLDLAQAEAVADLIRAETDAAARVARAQLAGGFSSRVESLRERLINLTAEIEARIDFPDEGIEPADRARLTADFDAIGAELAALLVSRRRGALLREGARVALVGRPNVGKSSLLNALARTDRAIVTPHPGTTRDTIECAIDLGGAPVTLIDTAGLREATEPIERIGIERARRAIETADYVIEVLDATVEAEADPGEAGPNAAILSNRAPCLRALNKIDLVDEKDAARIASCRDSAETPLILVSARTGEGLAALEDALEAILTGEGGGEKSSDIAVNARHGALLALASQAAAAARRAWDAAAEPELLAIDLREALTHLDEILGLGPNEAILDRIFERFCLGK